MNTCFHILWFFLWKYFVHIIFILVCRFCDSFFSLFGYIILRTHNTSRFPLFSNVTRKIGLIYILLLFVFLHIHLLFIKNYSCVYEKCNSTIIFFLKFYNYRIILLFILQYLPNTMAKYVDFDKSQFYMNNKLLLSFIKFYNFVLFWRIYSL